MSLRVWNAAARTPWAITEPALRNLLEIAARQNQSLESLEKEIGHPLENTQRVTVRDGVAIVPVTGPLFRYANLFTRISGATSYDQIALDFNAALDDDAIKAVLLNINSPGGEVNGCSELAAMIHAARGRKPIESYIGGPGASGAYWIASAADKITVADTAITGSLGVVAVYTDFSEAQKKAGIQEIEILSSQSPKKRPDPTTDEGRAQIQIMINDLAQIFVESVARQRGVSVETVLEEFGQGDVFVGEKAVTAGLADRVGSFEAVLADLIERTASDRGTPASGGLFHSSSQERTMAEKPNATPAAENQPAPVTAASIAADHPEVAEQLRAEGRTAGTEKERARILGIDELTMAGHEELIATCKKDPACTPEMAAVKLVQAQQAAAAADNTSANTYLRVMAGDEEALDPPAPSVDSSENSEEALALSIARAGETVRPKEA